MGCHDSEITNIIVVNKNSPLPFTCSFTVTASRVVVQPKIRNIHVHKQIRTEHSQTNANCSSGSHVLTLALTLNTGYCHRIALLSWHRSYITRYRVNRGSRFLASSVWSWENVCITGTWYMSIHFSFGSDNWISNKSCISHCSKSKVLIGFSVYMILRLTFRIFPKNDCG
jgi:hypothetical protein